MSSELNLVLHEQQAATYLGVSVATLRRWRRSRRGPSFVRYARSVLYRKQQLDKFMNQHTKNPKSQGQAEQGDVIEHA